MKIFQHQIPQLHSIIKVKDKLFFYIYIYNNLLYNHYIYNNKLNLILII